MRFKRIYIEITNICNLNCAFCTPHTRENKYMNFEEFKQILDKIKPFTEYIYLHVKGEPLLHKDVDKFVKYAYDNGFKINLTTNATLLKNHLEITKYLRQINVSLHATNNKEIVETCSKITDCIVNFRIWTFDESEEPLECIKDVFNLKQVNFKVLAEKEKISNYTISKNMFISTASKFEWPDMNSENSTNGYCHALKDQIAILVDGSVIPCCLDNNGELTLGNIFNNSLENIITSNRAVSIRNGFNNRIAVEELCKKCTYKNRF